MRILVRCAGLGEAQPDPGTAERRPFDVDRAARGLHRVAGDVEAEPSAPAHAHAPAQRGGRVGDSGARVVHDEADPPGVADHRDGERGSHDGRVATDHGVEVQVIEHVEGDWDLVSSSIPPTRLDAGTVGFPVTVPAFGTAPARFRYVRRNLAP